MKRPFLRSAKFAALIASCAIYPALAAEPPSPITQNEIAVALAPHPPWSLRIPAENTVAFRGQASFDSAGMGSAQIMYPAPNAAGLLAAMLTHGLLLDSAQKSQKEKIQATADQVLTPYRPVLEKFSNRELILGASARITPSPSPLAANEPAAGIWVETAPLFAITPDQSAVVLDNTIVIHTPAGDYKNLIRVVSPPISRSPPSTAWNENGGKMLKEVSAQLLAISLNLALEDARRGAELSSQPYKTLRYREGGEEKIERAQLIEVQCNRLVLRNLRGQLMVVPPPQTISDHESCGNKNQVN